MRARRLSRIVVFSCFDRERVRPRYYIRATSRPPPPPPRGEGGLLLVTPAPYDARYVIVRVISHNTFGHFLLGRSEMCAAHWKHEMCARVFHYYNTIRRAARAPVRYGAVARRDDVVRRFMRVYTVHVYRAMVIVSPFVSVPSRKAARV